MLNNLEMTTQTSPGSIAAIVTAALAGMAMLNTRFAHKAEQGHPPKGRIVDVDGLEVHALVAGRGDPIVLLHGNGSAAGDFVGCGLFDELARHYQVFSFDRPGYGYSERPRDRLWTARAQAEHLASAFQKFGIERPIVVGHSWGTLVALELALLQHRPVKRLVLMSGYYFPTPRADAIAMSPPAIPVLGDVMRYTVSPLVSRAVLPAMLKTMFSPHPVDARFERAVPKSMMVRPWQLKASAEDSAFMLPSAAALRDRYQDVDVPVTIVSGDSDRIVSPKHQSMQLRTRLRKATLEIVEGAGHMVHYAQPALVAALITGPRATTVTRAQTTTSQTQTH
ncbi:MAG TPA: alpha/beta hydrolase [Burkholderiaceae bacterium]|nr:alpha/beta hydrolase [Burkholderiaceae bacterium]